MAPYNILLVEDENSVRDFMKTCLMADGYQVSEAENMKSAELFINQSQPDLIVLDILLPDGSGLDLCRNLRGVTQAPVLFVTCLGEKSQIVQGLRAGADDYIVKPLDADEFVARIEALLRRMDRLQGDVCQLPVSQLSLEPKERRAKWAGKDLVLSPKEYQILSVLCRNRNRYTTTKELYSEVWGMSAHKDVRTVKVHISGLRRKLCQVAGDNAVEVVHQKDRGYRLEFFEEM